MAKKPEAESPHGKNWIFQEDLAKAVGVSRQTINMDRTGRLNPNP